MQAAVSEFGIAPGKSMRASEDVESIRISHRGVEGDREYMWVEAMPHTNVIFKKAGKIAAAGQFLSQREDPSLTGIIPEITPDGLYITWQNKDGLLVPRAEDAAANRIPVSVWGWRGEAVDQGDEAAEWGEEYIGRPVRLVAVSDEKPRHVEGNPALGRVGFADGYAVTVGSTLSLNKLNAFLESAGRPALPHDRTRTTILLDGLADLGEHIFPEDYIETIHIASNGLSAVLRRRKACGRCPIPDTNQVTGERKTDFRFALGKLGRNGTHTDTERYGTDVEIFFTQNFVLELPDDMPEGAVINLYRNTEVDIEYSDTTNWIPLKRAA